MLPCFRGSESDLGDTRFQPLQRIQFERDKNNDNKLECF
jgi:hypothetical protein